MTQIAFDFFEQLDRVAPQRRGRVKIPLSRAQYDQHLGRALHTLSLSHPVYLILLTAAAGEQAKDPLTTAGISIRLGMSYHGVVNHTGARTERDGKGKGSPHLFHIDKQSVPYRVFPSAEGAELLARVHRLIDRYAAQP